MTLARKRRHCSSSSDSSASRIALRPKCPLPTRRARKVARQSTSHCIAVIPSSLQQHRSQDPSFSSSESEVSAGETELGTALSEVESALPAVSSNISHSDGEMDISSPSKEENEVDDNLGSVGMSSPSPLPRGWISSGKMPMMCRGEKDRDVVDRAPCDVKRRRLHEVVQDDDAEADDEMEETERIMATPKQNGKRGNRKSYTLRIPTPSIQRITDGFNGLTPYPKEIQSSLDTSPGTSSSWTYGPLSSPIRLAGDTPPFPIIERTMLTRLRGQHTRPNKNLQRRSPTSLIPSRHRMCGRFQRARATSRFSHRLLPNATAIVGQLVLTHFHLLKDARTKRRHAVARQNAQIDYTALAATRARCFEYFSQSEAWRQLLADVGRGCWWWPAAVKAVGTVAEAVEVVEVEAVEVVEAVEAMRAVQAVQLVQAVEAVEAVELVEAVEAVEVVEAVEAVRAVQLVQAVEAAVPDVDEAHVDCLVGHVATEAAGDAEAVIALISSSPVASGRREEPTDDASDPEAESHRARTASRATARQAREAEWSLSSERAAAQRRRLGRLAAAPLQRPIRHISSLNPAWLQAVRIPAIPPPAPVVADIPPAEELEGTDVEPDSDAESAASDPPEYDSGTYPRHIPFPTNNRSRQPPSPIQQRLPSYAVNRYTRRSPSPPPPYNAATDRQTIVAPYFIDTDSEDEEEATNTNSVAVAVAVAEQRVVGAFPSAARWSPEHGGRNRFDAALEMEEGEDADLIDELTANVGYERTGEGVVSAIGGFLGRFFGRR